MLSKKTVYNILVAKVKNIYTIDVLKTKYDIYEADLEMKITDAERKKILILGDLLKNRL